MFSRKVVVTGEDIVKNKNKYMGFGRIKLWD